MSPIPQTINWSWTFFCRFLQQTSSSRLTGWMASPNESLNLRKYIFLRSELHINETAPSKKTWPHCVECCHFRLLEWAHGLATFFLLFLHAKIVTRSAKRLRQEYCYLNLYSHFAFWSRLVYHNGSKFLLKGHYSFVYGQKNSEAFFSCVQFSKKAIKMNRNNLLIRGYLI